MTKIVKILSFSALVLALYGCGPAAVVKAGKPEKFRDMVITSPIDWNQFGNSRTRFWTLDGPILNSFRIYSDIKPGEHLMLLPRGRIERRGEGVLFRPDMEALEVAELFVDLLKQDQQNVRVENLRPQKFGTRQGFRFDLFFVVGQASIGTKSGLKYRATVLAEVEDGTLSYCMFDAPEEFYYTRDLASVEKILASIQAP